MVFVLVDAVVVFPRGVATTFFCGGGWGVRVGVEIEHQLINFSC